MAQREDKDLRALHQEPQVGHQSARWSEALDVVPMSGLRVGTMTPEALSREAIDARRAEARSANIMVSAKTGASSRFHSRAGPFGSLQRRVALRQKILPVRS